MYFVQVEIWAACQEYDSRKQSENTITVKDNAVAYAEQQKAQSHGLFIFIFSVCAEERNGTYNTYQQTKGSDGSNVAVWYAEIWKNNGCVQWNHFCKKEGS